MAELIPVGIFELFVFRLAGDPSPDGDTKYAVQIVVPEEFRDNTESWIEAAACLTSYIARHCDLGYEKSLEVITERAMVYRDDPPPNQPVSQLPPDPGNPTDVPDNPNFPKVPDPQI